LLEISWLFPLPQWHLSQSLVPGRVISSHRSRLALKTVEGLMCLKAWSVLICFMIALLTCLNDEEEEMVTRTHSLIVFVHTFLSSLFFNIALTNFFSIFLFIE
jgi:hypothetical protein